MARTPCLYGDWSAPEAMAPAHPGLSRAAHFIRVAMLRGTPVVAASTYRMTGVAATPVAIEHVGQGDLGRPQGDFAFAFPRIVVDRDDVLHLLWGEPGTGHSVGTFPELLRAPIGSVWTSAHDGARGWSEPRRLLEGRRIMWRRGGIQVSLDPAGDPLVGVIGQAAGGEEALIVLRLIDSAWRTTAAPTRGLVAVRAALWQGDPVACALVAAGPAAPGLSNVVIARWSDGAGAPDVRIVDRSSQFVAEDVGAFAGRGGTVQLVWLLGASDGDASIVRRATVDLRGTIFGTDELAVASPIHHLRAVADACGFIHVLFETTRDRRERYVMWSGEWGAPEKMPGAIDVDSSDLHAAKDGTLVAALIERPEQGPESDGRVLLAYKRMVERAPG